MGMRDKKRNQKRVLARRTAAPRSGEGKDFLVSGSPLSSSFFFFLTVLAVRWGERALAFFLLILPWCCCGVLRCVWCSRWKKGLGRGCGRCSSLRSRRTPPP